ncbi:IPT/TIG domain-containing protein [Tieghemostelium lacteum]|uniref:IPT/TIG domain-containing protein n=1 Tax=Tieghemostelium lacteum TaxID=361077 RepID=A0A152A637_TIELA|nr:IPT/TIG domain-containing protein [Tieghemostelium lacteum]|eukprot:KYR01688.1 IPT/TIG domain-containing protein [Tieghemostelium lacteum]
MKKELIFLLFLYLVDQSLSFTYSNDKSFDILTFKSLKNIAVNKITAMSSQTVYNKPNGFKCSAANQSCEITLPKNAYSEIYQIVYDNSTANPNESKLVLLNPVINAVSKPSTINGSITLTGYYLKPTDGTISASYEVNGQTTQENSIQVISPNQITFSVIEGSGDIYGEIFLELNFDKEFHSTYQNPTVKTVTTNENQLIIDGMDFGNKKEYIQVKLDGVNVDAEDILSSTHTEIVLKNNQKVSKKISLDINVNTISMLAAYQFSNIPILDSVNSVSSKGGVVSIQGGYLNCLKEDGTTASSVQVLIGGLECLNPKNPIAQNYSLLVCDIGPDPNKGDNLPIIVTIDSISSTSKLTFSYGLPIIRSYKDNSDGKLIILGESLGSTATSVVVLNNVTLSNPVVSDTFDQLTIDLPANSQNGKLYVLVNNKKKSNILDIELVPIVKSISKPPTEGGLITIQGSFLRLHDFNGNLLNASLPISNSTCAEFIEDSQATGTWLQCKAPAGSGISKVVLQIGSKSSVPSNFSYISPSILYSNQSISNGLLTGTNFGLSSNLIQVVFNGVLLPNSSVIKLENNQITFNIPPLEKSGNVSVLVDGLPSNEIQLNIVPQIGLFSAPPTKGGDLTIFGAFFYSDNGSDFQVQVGSVKCANARPDGELLRSIICTIPEGSGGGHPVTLTINSVVVENPNNVLFSYLLPTVLEAYASPGFDIKKGGQVTIKGHSFHPKGCSVFIGVQECTSPVVIDYEEIRCNLPPSSMVVNGKQNVTVTADGLVSQNLESNLVQFEYPSSPNNDDGEARRKRLRWLVPAIVVPCFVGIVTIAVVTVILVKKHHNAKMSGHPKAFKG